MIKTYSTRLIRTITGPYLHIPLMGLLLRCFFFSGHAAPNLQLHTEEVPSYVLQ